MVGALLITCTLIPRYARAADANASTASVDKLLDQARFQAYRLDVDADDMTSLLRSEVGWQSKADDLTRIKWHVNDLGKLLAELQSSRVDASPWQKEAIDRMVPLLREVAAITTDEIDFLNAHQNWPNTPEYSKWANENFTASHELADLISETVQYGRDRADSAQMAADLHLQTRASSSSRSGQYAKQ